jgi:hypothetical protein
MTPTFDWMHGLALALGAVAAFFFPKKSGTATTTPTTSPGAVSPHPLFDALIQVLEGKLTDLIHIEPGPNGEPMFTVRVVLVQGEQKK